MIGIDHGQPGGLTLPAVLEPGTGVGTPRYARWAERTRLVGEAEERRREHRLLARTRRRAADLRGRADRAEARVRRLEAVARAH